MSEGVFGLLCVIGLIAAGVYMILNPETVGQATGYLGHGRVSGPTPAFLVRYAGCVIVAVLPGGAVGSVVGLWWVGVLAAIALATAIYILAGRWWPLDE